MIDHKEIFSCCSALTEHVFSAAAQPSQTFVAELSKNWSQSFRAMYDVIACLRAWTKILPVKEDIEEREFDDIATDIVTKLETADLAALLVQFICSYRTNSYQCNNENKFPPR